MSLAEVLNTIERFGVTPRSSAASVHQDTAYFAITPQQPYDGSLSTVEQAKQMFSRADERLASVGSDRSRILFCAILLRDIGDVAVFNEEWDKWVVPGPAPSRACFGVELANPAMKVEMIIIAAANPTTAKELSSNNELRESHCQNRSAGHGN